MARMLATSHSPLDRPHAVPDGRHHLAGDARQARNLLLACMIPFWIMIGEAASPHSSLAFMFWGADLLPADAPLHGRQLQRFQRQGSFEQTDDCRFHTRKLGGSSATILG
jgi:hypothetical protein